MSQTPDISAQHAIDTIGSIREAFGPAYCAFIVAPNTVLTLANARLYADGVFYHPQAKIREQWQRELQTLFDTLKKSRDFGLTIGEDVSPAAHPYVNYDLLNPAGLKNSLQTYSFFTAREQEQLMDRARSLTLLELLKSSLKKKLEFKRLDEEYIGHVCSGVILGYPEKAILGSLELWQKDQDTFAERPVSADIRGADYYMCPQPVYEYPRRLANDPQINAHEKLWTGVLKDFYTSEFHQELAKDSQFKKKIRELSEH